MKKLSRKKFLEKLMFFMSFHFNDEESRNILGDYEEWFANEALQGKTEEEICLSLGSPRKVAADLLTESSKPPKPIRILLQNTMIQCFLLMCVHCLFSILLLKSFNRTSTSYLYSGFVLLLMYFVIGSFVSKNPHPCQEYEQNHIFYRIHFILFGFAVVMIGVQTFVFPRIHVINAGEICCYFLSLMIAMIFLANICIVRNLFQNKGMCILITLHMLGILTILFYMINQLHMLWPTEIYGSLGIYMETVLLCFGLSWKARTKWTLN